jgi:hypothetical protein
MDKWEYCLVGPLSTSLRSVVPDTYCEVCYLTGSGIQQQTHFNVQYLSQDTVHYAAQVICLLGDDGWELVGSGSGMVPIGTGVGEMGHMLYFKRKKQ